LIGCWKSDFYARMPRYTAALLLLTTVSCVAEALAREEDGDLAFKATIPAKGADDNLDVASWDIEFFGRTSNGPTNETLQLSNVRDVIAGTDVNIWGVAEIVSTSTFNALASSDGVSITRNPDDRTGLFVLHDTRSSSASSPGTRVNGSAF
jgi:hypothetical protein